MDTLYSRYSWRSFWSELRKSDRDLHKQAVTYQRCLRRKQKAELDHAFCCNARSLMYIRSLSNGRTLIRCLGRNKTDTTVSY